MTGNNGLIVAPESLGLNAQSTIHATKISITKIKKAIIVPTTNHTIHLIITCRQVGLCGSISKEVRAFLRRDMRNN